MANEEERYHIGTTIAGRYHVERAIGEGAMGTVSLARHLLLDEQVAIKSLRPELRRDPAAIARLSAEARALSRIKSDHVTRVLDVGATLAIGPYMVMEYLEGTDLGDVLEAEGPLPVERVVEIVMQVCEALTVAHTAGIVHRDIKPENLFLARHGQFETVKVLDFGISEDETGPRTVAQRDPAHAGERARRAQHYGTPSHMSPERVRNDASADHRSDIWSIGVVLHELVTGRGVFDAPTMTETCARIVSDAPLELENDERVLPRSLRNIIARCLERDPGRRYQSVEELAAALAPLGTMTERFRGRSTGAFSRKYAEEQLALSRTHRPQLPPPGATLPTVSELSAALSDIGSALRSALRAVPLARFQDRPLWQYGAAALGSALAVVIATSFASIDWMVPRSPAMQSESLEPGEKHAVRGLDQPISVAAPESTTAPDPAFGVLLAPSLEPHRPRVEQGARELAVTSAGEPEVESPVPPVALERAPRAHRAVARVPRAKRKSVLRKRAAELPLLPKDGFEESAQEPGLSLVPERPRRVRRVSRHPREPLPARARAPARPRASAAD